MPFAAQENWSNLINIDKMRAISAIADKFSETYFKLGRVQTHDSGFRKKKIGGILTAVGGEKYFWTKL